MIPHPISKMYRRHQQLLPLLLLLFYCIRIIIAVAGDDAGNGYSFEPRLRHFLAFTATAACVLIYFLLRRLYPYVLGVTIVLALFGIIGLSAAEFTAFVSVNGFKLSFQPQALLVALVACIVNWRRIKTLVLDLLRTGGGVEAIAEQGHADDAVQRFREQYAAYDMESLEQIARGNRHVPTATEAARQLLSERQTQTKDI